MTIDELQTKFGIENVLGFEPGQGDLPRIAVKTEDCEGHIYLHGAHITHYQRTGEPPLLFLSQKSNFAPGKPIRGGVPICFPWFSNHGPSPESPMHGFARTTDWEVIATRQMTPDSVMVMLQLSSNDTTRKLWPEDFQATFQVIFGKQLTMSLEVKNTSPRPFKFEEALHTYLAVGDINQVTLRGLANVKFTTKVAGQQSGTQDRAPITFTAETDRVYTNTSSNCTVEDLSLRREIIVAKTDSMTTVVWNPWVDRSKALADFGDDEYKQMLCVETANAYDSAVTLQPGQTRTMSAVLVRRALL